MIIAVAVLNASFGPTMDCYVAAGNSQDSTQRQMFEEMDHIAAQNPSGARAMLGLSNVAHSLSFAKPASFFSPAPEQGRHLQYGTTLPNDDSCPGWGLAPNDGTCEDGGIGSKAAFCECGTDVSDCGPVLIRVFLIAAHTLPTPLPPSSDYGNTADYENMAGYRDYGYGQRNTGSTHGANSEDVSTKAVEDAVLGVFNPLLIIPGIICSLFLLCASALTLKNPDGCAMVVFMFGTIFVFVGLIIYVISTFIFLVYVNVFIDMMKSATTPSPGMAKCIDDSQAMFSGVGVGCLIGSIGAFGSFVAAICATCGIRKVRTKEQGGTSAHAHYYDEDQPAPQVATAIGVTIEVLSGGHITGDTVYYTGKSHTFPSGNKLVQGQQGEVTGSGSGEKKDTHLLVLFPGNKGSVGLRATDVSRDPAPLPGGLVTGPVTARGEKKVAGAHKVVIVTDVAGGCAASNLVVKGDTILAINGTPLTDEVQGRALARAAVGKVDLSILRGGAHVTITADKPEAATRLGVTMKNLPLASMAQPMAAPVVYAQPMATSMEGTSF